MNDEEQFELIDKLLQLAAERYRKLVPDPEPYATSLNKFVHRAEKAWFHDRDWWKREE